MASPSDPAPPPVSQSDALEIIQKRAVEIAFEMTSARQAGAATQVEEVELCARTADIALSVAERAQRLLRNRGGE